MRVVVVFDARYCSGLDDELVVLNPEIPPLWPFVAASHGLGVDAEKWRPYSSQQNAWLWMTFDYGPNLPLLHHLWSRPIVTFGPNVVY